MRLTLLMIAAIGTPSLSAQARWSVDAKPILDISGPANDRRPAVRRPVAGLRLADGTIVIGDEALSAVRYFDRSGELIVSVGNQGPGWRRGEFRSISWMSTCGTDSLFVWDQASTKMSVLKKSRKLGAEYHIPDGWAFRSRGGPIGLACTAGGTLVLQHRPKVRTRANPDVPIIRGAAEVVLADMRGEESHTLLEAPSSEMAVTSGATRPAPLGRRTSLAIVGDRVYVGTGDDATISVFGLDGQPAGSLDLGLPETPATAEQLRRAVDHGLAFFDEEVREQFRTQFMEIPVPNRLPAYYDLIAGGGGMLWVVLTPAGEPQTRLRGLGADGSAVADLTIPGPVTVLEIGSDYVLGTLRDDTGTAHVVVYRLTRGTG